MRKIVLILLFLAAAIGLFVLFYQSFEDKKSSEVDVLQAIPQSAALIFETDGAGDLWHDLSQSNLIWEELQATDYYFRLNEIGLALDSMLTKQPDLRSYLSDLPSVVSVHSDGSSGYNYLLGMPVKSDISQEAVIGALHSLMRVKDEVVIRPYDGVAIHSLLPRLFDNPIHVYLHDGILVISLSEILVEESIRALQQDASVNSDEGFLRVRKTKGLDARGQLYVNYAHIKSIISQYAAGDNKGLSFFHQPFAEWSALDLDLKASSASLNGFVLCNDSSEAWLGAFRNVRETDINALDFMPSNTAFFTYFGFGDYSKFRLNQSEIRELNGQKYSFEKAVSAYEEKCNCDIERLALDWIGTQVATFITEPASENYTQNYYALFQATEIEEAWSSLLELEQNLNDNLDIEAEENNYKGFEIHQLQVGQFFGDVLSQAFTGIENPYFIQTEDVVLMANSVNALRVLIDGISRENTLANDSDFKELSEKISGEPQFLVYSSLARSPYIYQNILDDSYAKDIAKQTEVLRKFQAFIYEVSYFKNDLFYNNIYFKHNPTYEQETNSLWEKQLPDALTGRPYFVKNHYTGALEILVQDVANRIYLLSNTGKILWQKALDGPIVGGVEQIDIYKNKKLQMLFSTEKSIYLLDRNGGYVESFPVRLKAPATVPVSVMDYDKSRDYRIFIGTEGGASSVYDATGKEIEGWKFNTASANIVEPFQHIRIRSKDYIYTADATGKIHLLNRKGKSRHAVSTKMNKGLNRAAKIQIGEKINSSQVCFVDSSGQAHKIGFNDRFDNIPLSLDPVIDFNYLDLDGDDTKEWVVLTDSEVQVYSDSGEELYSIPSNGSDVLLEISLGANKPCIGLVDSENAQIFILNANGEMHTGFPLYGERPFVVDDMNGDGHLNLVTFGPDGFIYAYSIEE